MIFNFVIRQSRRDSVIQIEPRTEVQLFHGDVTHRLAASCGQEGGETFKNLDNLNVHLLVIDSDASQMETTQQLCHLVRDVLTI